MNGPELLRITHLTVTGSRHYPLCNVDFRIFPNQITGILGLHDSGLSTLIKLFAGEAAPDQGYYFYCQKPCTLPQIRRKILLLRKESALTPNQTVLENIFYMRNKQPFFFWAREKRCRLLLNDLLAELSLSLDIEKRGDELTDKERIIVECLKAIAEKKELIIFEDIFPSLSSDHLTAIKQFLRRLTAAPYRLTLVLTANQPRYIRLLADHIIFMAKGHCVYDTKNMYSDEEYEAILSPEKSNPPPDRKQTPPSSVPQDKRCVPNHGTLAAPPFFAFRSPQIGGAFTLLEHEMTVVIDPFFILRGLIKRVSLEGLKRGESCAYPGYAQKEPPPCIFLTFNVNEQIIENLSVIDNLVLQKPGNFVKYGFIHKQRLSALGEDFCDWCRERNISYDFVNNKNCYDLTDFEKMSVYLFKYHLSRKPIIFITDPLVYFDIDMVDLVFGEIRRWQAAGTTICIFVSEIRKTYSFASRILSVDHCGNILEHD